MCCKSRAFVENEYTTHRDYNVFNTKYANKSIDDITQKGNLTKSSIIGGGVSFTIINKVTMARFLMENFV